MNKKIKNNPNLTLTEEKVIMFMAKGLDNKEIAAKLFISIPTVKRHIENIYSKYHLSRKDKGFSAMRVSAVLKYLKLEVENGN